jgi:[ribosomal protein S18]-alanine N-acetyltransferase
MATVIHAGIPQADWKSVMVNEAEIVSSLQFRPLRPSDAEAMISWRYPPPYSEYEINPRDSKVLAELLRPENDYHAILSGQEMIGFFCTGPDARVPGWNYDDSALDLGMGLRPDLTGQGKGSEYFGAVISYLEQEQPARKLRATIAGWNRRAIHLCERAGFREIAKFNRSGDGQGYVVLQRET